MPCPSCAATATTEQPRRTALGYRTFRCRACRRTCNERTGTPLQYFRARTRLGEHVSLADRRHRFRARWATLLGEVLAA